MILKLPSTTEYVRVRRYRLVATPELVKKHQANLTVENQLHNYALKYLERAYGYKHLFRKFPGTRTGKTYVIKDEILPSFLKEYYGLKRWSSHKVGFHSQAAYQSLLALLTNFGEYRKVLRKAAKMTDQAKEDYRNNKHHNNPRHRSWYRKGSLNYLRNGASHQTVSLPDNGQIAVLSAHHIKVQDYGSLQVVENIINLKHQKIVASKIKHKRDNSYELQLVFKDKLPRRKPTDVCGVDWNMKDRKIFHTSDNKKLYLDKLVSVKADKYERIIDGLKSRRDKATWLGQHSRRIQRLNNLIRFYNIHRANILTNHYRHLTKRLFNGYDLLVVEKLSAKEMRQKSQGLDAKGNHTKNRRLAKIKPYELQQCLKQVADRSGKTLVLVDSYKTSQVEYGTGHQEKHSLDDPREWTSKYTGKKINRDLNASRNILKWGLNPEKHIKLKDYPALKPSSLVTIN